MARAEEPHDQAEQLFLRRESAGTNSLWWLLGGLGCLAMAAVGFAVAIVGQVGRLSMIAMTVLPTMFGLGAITAAWSLAGTPEQVAVGPRGLRILRRRGGRSYQWDQIGWATVTEGALDHRRRLVIFDTGGRTVANLSEAFGDFDAMV